MKYIHLLDKEIINRTGDFNELVSYDFIIITKDSNCDCQLSIGRVKFNDDEDYNDGVRYIFISYNDRSEDTQLGKILHDLNCNDASKMYSTILKEKYLQVINNLPN